MIFLIFLFGVITGGSAAPLIKYAVNEFPPALMVLMRSFLTSAILLPFFLKLKFKLKLDNNFKLLLMASSLFCANWFAAAYAVKNTSVIMNQIIYAPAPVLVALLGYYFLNEKLNKSQLIGLVLTIVGMTLLIYTSFISQDILSFGTPLGNTINVLGLIIWSIYLILSRKISSVFSPLRILFANFVVTFFVAVIINASLISLKINDISNIKFTFANVSSIVLIALFSSILFFYIYQWLIKKTSAFNASLMNYSGPIIAAFTGPIFFHERISLRMIIGAVLIIGGVFIATTYNKLSTDKNLWIFR